MARVLSRLQILLHADTARATSELQAFKQKTGKIFEAVKESAKTMALGVSAGASAAAVAVASVTKEHMALVSELQKTARLANTTASEIQKYTFAAKSLGIEQEKLGDIFKDTQDKVGDFLTTGGGEMADFFEHIAPQIGVTAEQFRKLNGADALQLYYTSLEKANLSQSEMVFYMESIADEASLLMPLLADGGAGFKLWGDMASQAGAIMNDETLVAAQKLNASTEILNLTWTGAKNQLVQALIPALSDVAGELIKNGETAKFAKQAGESLVAVLKLLAKTAVGATTAFMTLGKVIGGVFATLHNIATGLDFSSLPAFFKSVATTPITALNTIKATFQDISATWLSSAQMLERIDKLGTGGTNAQVAAVMKLNQAQQKYNRQLGKTGSELAEARKEAEKLAKTGQNKPPPKSLLPSHIANAILWGANELKIDPNYLASGISFETGGTFSTNARNPKSSGTGLIQFMDGADGKTDKRYYGMNRDQFGSLSHMEQMKYVVKYFKDKRLKAGASLGDVYDAVTGYGYKKGTKAYNLNKVWDTNKDGVIAKGESIKSGAFKAHIKPFFSDTKVSLEQLGQWQTDQAKEAYAIAQHQLAIAKTYADKRKLIEINLQADIEKIRQAGFDAAMENGLIARAKRRAEIELALFDNARIEKLHAINEYRLSERQLIIANFNKERQAILNNSELAFGNNRQYRDELLKAIDDKERYELDKFRLTQEQKRFELNQDSLSALERIKAYHELERREIALTSSEFKKEMMAKSQLDEISEIEQLKADSQNKVSSLFADLTGNSNLLQVQQEYQARKQIIDEALANEAITIAEHQAMLEQIERTAYEARRQLITQNMEQVAGALTQITGDLLGKQSKAYRVMFAVEKGFAIARSAMAIQTGIAQAAALPFPANFPAMASVITATASIISTLQSVRQPIGQAHDGIMSVPESGTWNLQKGERVLPQYTAKRLDKTLDNLQGNKGLQVFINNHTTANVSATQDDDGKLKILITHEINKQIPSQLANPNSPIAKGLKNNWQILPKR